MEEKKVLSFVVCLFKEWSFNSAQLSSLNFQVNIEVLHSISRSHRTHSNQTEQMKRIENVKCKRRLLSLSFFSDDSNILSFQLKRRKGEPLSETEDTQHVERIFSSSNANTQRENEGKGNMSLLIDDDDDDETYANMI